MLAFFFLLQPGKHIGTRTALSSPFRWQDAQLFIGSICLDKRSAPDSHLDQATFCTLESTDQKNGVQEEVIGLGLTSDFSSVAALHCLSHQNTSGQMMHLAQFLVWLCTFRMIAGNTSPQVKSLRFCTQR
mmetsp:Transcript_7381/g.11221  ORF Transcript_7381/g.11221 Transcript_7381/m.11221 type:complete len:130 (-) Transcript_7381:227-616(-)